jgi:hypothetical protein
MIFGKNGEISITSQETSEGIGCNVTYENKYPFYWENMNVSSDMRKPFLKYDFANALSSKIPFLF